MDEVVRQQLASLEARLAAAEARIRSLEARNRPIGPKPRFNDLPLPPLKPRFLRDDGTG